jgi:S1-C subfamily serine protease
LGILSETIVLPENTPEEKLLELVHKLNKDAAVEIVGVEPFGPAKSSGLRTGDVVVAINQEDVTSVDDMFSILAEWPVGKPISLTVIRGKERTEISIVPIEAK